MKTKKVIVEIICLILLMNFFYEGIYKVAYFQNYGFWLTHAPLLSPIGKILNYVVPLGELVLAIMFIVPSYKKIALYGTIVGLFVFALWIMSVYLFTHRLFWPYHALWEKPTWMQKMLISIGFCWMAFTAIVLSNGGSSFKRISSNSLRNTPANAH